MTDRDPKHDPDDPEHEPTPRGRLTAVERLALRIYREQVGEPTKDAPDEDEPADDDRDG